MPISGLVAALGTEAVATMPSGSKGPLPPNEDADNPLYKEDNFRMWCLKVLPCSKRYCHDWTTCPWAHAQEKAKRRDPRVYNYTGVACPEMKKSMQCPRGDQCPYAHNVFEYWLHHSRYRTQLCNDGVGCKRKICFFAHTLDELRVSSVKVQVPEGFRGEINSTAINPFAPSHSNSGSGKHNQASAAAQNGGNGYHGPRNGGQAGAGAANSGLSMAELQQFAALQAKLQASQQQQGTYNGTPGQLNNAMSGDQAAIDQLVQLMLMAQQQPQQQQQQQQQQQGSMVDPMTQMMAQVMLGQQQQAQQQQQQQAAAALQVQQQMAALQLLNQMQGLGAGYMQDPYNGGAAMGMGQEMMNGGPPQRYNSGVQSYSRGNSYTHQNSNLSQSRSPMPQAHQMQDMSDSVNELARQLSGLSASGKMPPALMTSSGGMGGGTSDGPGSARSFNSGGTPGGRQGSSRIARQHTQDSNGAMGAVGMGMKAQGGDAHGGAGSQPHGGQASARNPLLQHTSPVSISALGDGYATTATANSFFSASHSLTSSHDGSDLEVSHH